MSGRKKISMLIMIVEDSSFGNIIYILKDQNVFYRGKQGWYRKMVKYSHWGHMVMHLSLDLSQSRQVQRLVFAGYFYNQLGETGASRLRYRIPSEWVVFCGSLSLTVNGVWWVSSYD